MRDVAVSHGGLVENQATQNLPVKEECFMRLCVNNADVTIEKIEEGNLATRPFGVYLVQHGEGSGLRNPFGQTEEEISEIPGTSSLSTESGVGATGIPQPTIDRRKPPLIRWPSESYKLKGVLVSGHNSVAIVAPPVIRTTPPPDDFSGQGGRQPSGGQTAVASPGKEYVVKIGELFGNNDGKIISIGLKGLTVLEGENKVVVPLSQ